MGAPANIAANPPSTKEIQKTNERRGAVTFALGADVSLEAAIISSTVFWMLLSQIYRARVFQFSSIDPRKR